MHDIKKSDIAVALHFLLAQWGKDYIFGVEDDKVENPKGWDCSELSQITFNRALALPLPDGARYQFTYCQKEGRLIGPGEKALPLDLIFLRSRDTREIDHVAIVFGDMSPVGGVMLIEARGRPFGKVIITPMETFTVNFGDRVAGCYRLINPTE